MAKKHNQKTDVFVYIAQELGISVATAHKTYQSAMRKIRLYLFRNKQQRKQLQDGLETLESMKSSTLEKDINDFKGFD